jgi:hypothetical protein
MEGVIARSKTVTMNAAPRIRAASRRRVLSIEKFMCPECEKNNSEVTSRIIAVIAIQRLMSDMERGNCTGLTFYDSIPYFIASQIWGNFDFVYSYRFSGCYS